MKKELEDTIKEWLRFVEMDRSTARHLVTTMHPKPLEIICFHCQQAAEKAIKALFVLKRIEIAKIHDLGMLIKMIQTEIAFPDTIKISSISLTKYAAIF
ncbi:MAG: HEPN domain-containing protein [Treponema sp.]